jgi:hypothetical protein
MRGRRGNSLQRALLNARTVCGGQKAEADYSASVEAERIAKFAAEDARDAKKDAEKEAKGAKKQAAKDAKAAKKSQQVVGVQ